MHAVAVLAMDGVVGFELATPGQVFGSAADATGAPLYTVRVCGPTPEARASAAGSDLFTMSVPFGLDELRAADTIVVPAHETTAPVPADVAEAIRDAHREGRRIASICTGAGLLADIGLLDGRTATTHWRHVAELTGRFPDVRFDADKLYVDDRGVLTSAGVAAGIDLCLHMVRTDHGAAVAATAARRMVMSPHRGGGQTQFIAHDDAVLGDGPTAALMLWMSERLDRPLTLASIAAEARLSVRTLHRRFLASTGVPPMQWLLTRRIARAQELLESTSLSIEEVARHSGFGTAAVLREHFRRRFATTPTAYRRRFTVNGTDETRGVFHRNGTRGRRS
ncbi:GlxA family transcriptional regulator [Glycomyces paridis]|uniref:Helix-turn-helix domain-containing protein n=1 Tax=Glycomyces paridis TaxID=2126555 RepID=A0A4S8PMK8_9ACTN|nr:helix-turn-helix domain-containing protein [Glycomyces paridis]THV29534.1 helix-turn-helix domain-containing protein [Glycomyces paridis]